MWRPSPAAWQDLGFLQGPVTVPSKEHSPVTLGIYMTDIRLVNDNIPRIHTIVHARNSYFADRPNIFFSFSLH